MIEEFDLSKKIHEMRQDIYVEDVKEFIRLLKEEVKIIPRHLEKPIFRIIDKLAGEKLCQ